jgi:hypothetical protein
MKNWTPGRIAFEAFTESIAPNVTGKDLVHWVALKSSSQRAWEAAASAVLADGAPIAIEQNIPTRDTRWRPTEVPSVEPMPEPTETGFTPVEHAPDPATPIETTPDVER